MWLPLLASTAPAHEAPFPLSQGSAGATTDDDDDDDVEIVAAASAQGPLEAGGEWHSDDDSESCPICLNTFRGQAVGTPETCSHQFCLDCISEWSKVRRPLSGALPPPQGGWCLGLASCWAWLCSAGEAWALGL